MSKSYDEIIVGEVASFSKTISETDVYMYAGITGDFNPVHIDEESAKKGRFKKRIAHGMLVSGLISTVLGTKLPGAGAIYCKQEVNFLAPVYLNDTITASVEVVEKMEKGRIMVKTTCTNQDGVCVIDGSAILYIPQK